MIHRALLGSMERFAGVLIEHHAGRFPLWLAPLQAVVLPIADRHAEYAETIAERLRDAGLRPRIDARSESVGRKIRDAELAKVPLMLVVGKREEAEGTVTVRSHDRGDLGAVAPAEVRGLIDAS
jgi:threonyl-tRNA synthetase